MTLAIALDNETLKRAESLSSVRFGVVYEGVAAANIPGKTAQTASLVQRYGPLFGMTMLAVKDELQKHGSLREATTGTSAVYASYVAARVTTQHAKMQGNQHYLKIEPKRNPLSFEQADEKQLVQATLEELLRYSISSRSASDGVAQDYFSAIGNDAAQFLNERLAGSAVRTLKDTEWTIGRYNVNGMHLAKTAERKKSQETLQEELSIDEAINGLLPLQTAHALPRESIIGDEGIITRLERSIDLLLAYDFNTQSNCFKDVDVFENRILLQGKPGNGKGEVCLYILDYAQRKAKHQGIPIEFVRFNFESSWLNGNIRSAKEQFREIATKNKIYVIWQDEVGALFSAHGAKMDPNQNNVLMEFRQFLQGGQYPNRGNHLLIATVNDYNELDEAVVREGRFRTEHWAGAQTAEQNARLLETKFNTVDATRVSLSKQDYLKLGTEALRYDLSGAEMTAVCKAVKEKSFQYERVAEIRRIIGYDAKVAAAKQLFAPITYSRVSHAMEELMQRKTTARQYRGN